MHLPEIFEKYLRSHINFATFHLLDMVVTSDNKSIVFLVPREPNGLFNIQVNDESKYYGDFDRMMEYALHFKLISKNYKNTLTKRYLKFKGDIKNV